MAQFSMEIMRLTGSVLRGNQQAGFRARNRTRVLEKTQRVIVSSGLKDKTRPLDPRISGPILDAIADENDETLQDIWAAYIRNAVDPKLPSADRVLVDVIRKLEPGDWRIIEKLFGAPPTATDSKKLEVTPELLEPVMDRLVALSLFGYDDPKSNFIVEDGHRNDVLVVLIGEARYFENKLFRRLVSATAASRITPRA